MLTLCGCDRGAPASEATTRAARDAVIRGPGYIVDSIVPIEAALRRFREGLPEVRRLSGGARSRDALVAQFVRAVERGDNAGLRTMALTQAEYAYLVYPSSPFTRPPYRQQPEVAWLLLRTSGDAGLTGLANRLFKRSLGYKGYECAAEPVVEGENRLWRTCRVRYTSPEGAEARGALFGVIVERGGEYRFVNYANDL